MKLLWVTSFADDMWNASGKALLDSFFKSKSDGRVFIGTERIDTATLLTDLVKKRVTPYPLEADPYLQNFLETNADIIPQHLGGKHPSPECHCPKGPLSVHSKQHKQPCVGAWFNRNFSRWFRKIATMRLALEQEPDTEILIWIDADCRFTHKVTERIAQRWFGAGDNGIFYFKSKRPVIETGIVGYQLRFGLKGLLALFHRYDAGLFRTDPRWDDSMQTQRVVESKIVPSIDLARRVGAHSEVVPYSPVGSYIIHDKGKHSRGLGIMT